MNKFAALGLAAALAFAPVASFAQTDAPATAATPSASEASKSPVAKDDKRKAIRHNARMAAHPHKHIAKKKMAPAASPSASASPQG